MIKTLTKYEVVDILMDDNNANRTYEEAKALAEYYEEIEQQTGEEIESDYLESIENAEDNTTVIKVGEKYLVMDY